MLTWLATWMPGQRVRALGWKEVLTLGRGGTMFLMRTLLAGVIAFFVWAGMSFVLSSRSDYHLSHPEVISSAAAGAFSIVIVVQALVAICLGAILGAMSMAEEWRGETLGLMVLSPTRSFEIVLGKCIGTGLTLSFILFAGAPVLSLLGWAGGLDYLWVAKAGLLWAVLALLGIAIGISIGLRVRGMAAGAAIALLLSVFWLICPALLSKFASIEVLLRKWHSFSAVLAVSEQGSGQWAFYPGLLLTGGLGLLLLCDAVRFLPKAVGQGSRKGLRTWFQKADAAFRAINIGGIELARDHDLREVHGNPVAWLTRLTHSMGKPVYLFRICAVIVGASLLMIPLIIDGTFEEMIPLSLSTIFLLGALTAGASCIAAERGRKTLNVLVASSLSTSSILNGKLLTAIRLYVLFGIPLLCVFPLYALLDSSGSAWSGVHRAFFVTAEGMCLFGIAAACSLYRKTSLGAGLTAVLLAVLVHVLPPLGSIVAERYFDPYQNSFRSSAPGSGFLIFTAGMGCLAIVCIYLAVRGLLRRRPVELGLGLLGSALLAVGFFSELPFGDSSLFKATLDAVAANLTLFTGVKSYRAEEDAAYLLAGIGLLLVAGFSWKHTHASFDRVLGRAS